MLERIRGWANRCLSQGGKVVFFKSILQAIPIYPMSCFLFPSLFCKEIEAILCRYWWGKARLKRGILWSGWEALCDSKEVGVWVSEA